MSLLLLLLSCGTPKVEVPTTAPVDGLRVELSAPRLLRRMSLDLRGTLPSVEDLNAVEADEGALEGIRDAYLQDPSFEERMVQLWAERFLTRMDEFQVRYWDYGFEDDEEFQYELSVGEEPLRLVAHVIAEDLPWSEIVTADYTMANETTASIWSIDYPEGETGWQVAHYTDGRPAAGVLATNGLWWRYVTNISNMNRARAAAMTRLLLCQDLLSKPVSLNGVVSLTDEEGTANAIRNEPACVACHSTIEPLAANFFGFWTVAGYNTEELGSYHGEREQMSYDYLGVNPAYFGQPLEGLVDLGRAVAADPRFYSCAAESVAALLWRRDVDEQDFESIDDLRQVLLHNDLRMRPLIAAVTDTPEYREGGLADDASDEAQDREMTARMMAPDVIATTLEALTGFRWTWGGFDQLYNDDIGYRIMLGGLDGYTVGSPQKDPGVTWALTWQRVAEAAASTAVQRELVDGGDRLLLAQVSLDDQPGDAAFTAELEGLCWRLYAARPDASRIAELSEFWSAVDAIGGPTEAWTRTVSVMLRDPEFVGY